jgi:glycosyltransferase involved in cell wall biosynthesis
MYFDHWAAINTVHREVAKRLGDNFDVTAIVGNDSHNINKGSFDELMRIPNDDHWSRKFINYMKLYISNFDIVHTWGSQSDNLAILSKMRGAKLVHTMHTGNPDEVRGRQKFRDRADEVVSVSEYVRQIAYDGVDAREITVIPNGVNLNLFCPDAAKTENGLISYVGKNGFNKHPEFVLKIAEKIPQSDFLIIGAEFESNKLNREVPENVHISTKLSRKEVAKQLSRSQITLCPYEREAFCMTALESISAGTPVVGLARGNLVYLITDNSGVLCNELRTDSWVNAIRYIRNNYDEYSPREAAKIYDIEDISAQYEKLYQKILS